MTAPAWPASVPQVAKVDGFGEEPDRNVAEFQPEVGPPKMRRRTTFEADVLNFTTSMTFVEYDALVVFYRVNCADGVLTFTRKHPRDVTGSDLSFTFVDRPKLRAQGPTYGDVALSLRKMP